MKNGFNVVFTLYERCNPPFQTFNVGLQIACNPTYREILQQGNKNGKRSGFRNGKRRNECFPSFDNNTLRSMRNGQSDHYL